MSKVVDALRTAAGEFAIKAKSADEAPAQREKSSYELTQEQLADIYFSGSGKTKKSDYPLVIKVVERPNNLSWVPWLFSVMAFFLAIFAIFSTKKIFIDIRVVDQNAAEWAMQQDERSANQSEHMMSPMSDAPSLPPTDRLGMEHFIFEGAARLRSTKSENALTLVNSTLAQFARATYVFDKPVSLRNSKIVFYAKGQRGGENIALAFKDSDNVLAFERGVVFPFSNGLSNEWQRAEVSLDEAVSAFAVNRVQSMRFEFGTKDTDNRANDTIFIKDVRIVKNDSPESRA